jgi:hypothetical protein
MGVISNVVLNTINANGIRARPTLSSFRPHNKRQLGKATKTSIGGGRPYMGEGKIYPFF